MSKTNPTRHGTEENIDEVHRSFSKQAETFDTTRMNVYRRQHMEHMIELLSPLENESILEAAAGTCACGRALAGTAAAVTCLDTTPEMLRVGMDAARREGHHNMVFVLGDAAALPFPDESFDLALCRLAFHHIPVYEAVFEEMTRVVRPGGRLALIDLIAPEETERERKEHFEKIRDPSHARTLSKGEMRSLFDKAHLRVAVEEVADLPVSLADWLDVTKPGEEVCEEIRRAMRAEMDGGEKTGFDPYEKDGQIFFDQHWYTVIGAK